MWRKLLWLLQSPYKSVEFIHFLKSFTTHNSTKLVFHFTIEHLIVSSFSQMSNFDMSRQKLRLQSRGAGVTRMPWDIALALRKSSEEFNTDAPVSWKQDSLVLGSFQSPLRIWLALGSPREHISAACLLKAFPKFHRERMPYHECGCCHLMVYVPKLNEKGSGRDKRV